MLLGNKNNHHPIDSRRAAFLTQSHTTVHTPAKGGGGGWGWGQSYVQHDLPYNVEKEWEREKGIRIHEFALVLLQYQGGFHGLKTKYITSVRYAIWSKREEKTEGVKKTGF